MNKTIITTLLSFALYFFFHSTAKAQLSPAFTARLDKAFDSVCNRYKLKGASAALLVPGAGIWKGVHGLASPGVPVNSNMVFGIGSNTKPFISVCMLKLQEQGQLHLDDTIGKWIVGQLNISGAITIRQLLNHTSGLSDYTRNPAFNDSILSDLSRYWKKEEILHLVEAPYFTPGLRWDYCNTNYILAGLIIERVSGKSIERFIREQILTPGGLSSSYYFPFETPSNVRADQWSLGFGGGKMLDPETDFPGYSPISMFSIAASAGCILQTAEDNAKFWYQLTSGQLINATSFNEMRQYMDLGGGDGYGLGLFFYSKGLNGRSFYSHGGTYIGYIAENMVDTTSGICISVLTNQDSIDNNRLLSSVVGTLHKMTLKMQTTEIKTPAVNNGVQLFPNPASQLLRIRSDKDLTSCRISLFNVSGSEQFASGLDGRSEIDLSAMPSGYYFVNITDENGYVIFRDRISIVH